MFSILIDYLVNGAELVSADPGPVNISCLQLLSPSIQLAQLISKWELKEGNKIIMCLT